MSLFWIVFAVWAAIFALILGVAWFGPQRDKDEDSHEDTWW